MAPPSNPRNSSQSNQPRIAINPVKKPTTTAKVTTPTVKVTTPTVKVTPTPKINLSTTTPKITLSTASEPKLTLPTYSTGFTSNQRYQSTANNNYSQEDDFF